jgi:Fe-Mn family superoxide dismutase
MEAALTDDDDTTHHKPQRRSFLGMRCSTFAFGVCLLVTVFVAAASTNHKKDDEATVAVQSTAAPEAAAAPLSISQPPLHYSHDALAPYVSRETIDLHYGKHQAGYVAKVNAWLAAKPDEGRAFAAAGATLNGRGTSSLVTSLVRGLVKTSATFNSAAQIFNHALYFATLARDKPFSSLGASHEFRAAVDRDFGGFEQLREALKNEAVAHFGSGWVWLVANRTAAPAKLTVVSTHDAATPLVDGDGAIPLTVCDVWEHAYYVDYRNERPRYVDAWLAVVDWSAVAQRYSAGTVEVADASASVAVRSYPKFV